MAWITSYSSTSTLNIGPNKNAPSAIFALKELLKAVGWSVISSSDGTTYNASGDQVTHDGSGANGMNNNNAWFRIQDPGVLREYVFQRGTIHYSWKWIYSASDKFTGGTPSATVIPTATDQQGLARNATTFQTMFPTGAFYTQIAAQSAAHNGVYAWWLIASEGNVSPPEQTCMCCDSMDSAYSTSDNDPCIHYGSDDYPVLGNICTSSASSTDNIKGWMKYGVAGEEWGGLTGNYYYNSAGWVPSYGQPNPHNGKLPLLPIPFFRHTSTGSVIGFKGVAKYMRWCPHVSINYPTVLADTSDNYVVFGDLCFPGIPDGVVLSV